MADVKTREEGNALPEPEKRKLDEPKSLNKTLEEENKEEDANKRPKLETLPSETLSSETEKNGELAEDEDDEDYEAAEKHYNGETEVVDRKGKGIMVDDKGKGKMIVDDSDEEDEDNDDEDDSSDDSDSDFSDGLDDDSDLDDPLTEVDLDNILPSRTRRRGAQPGLRISGDDDKVSDA